MLKKFTVVSAGVAAALVCAAPLASASECHDGHDGHVKGEHNSDHGGWGHDKGHGDWKGGKGHGSSSNSNECVFKGGSANAQSESRGLLGPVAQAPIGGLVAPVLSCDNISLLNHDFNNNDVDLGLLG